MDTLKTLEKFDYTCIKHNHPTLTSEFELHR